MEPDRVVVVYKEMPMDVVMEKWVRFVAAAAAMRKGSEALTPSTVPVAIAEV